MAPADTEEYLIIGPSNAGKTALLATLSYAVGGLVLRGEELYPVRITNMNQEMQKLAALAGATPRTGSLPTSATESITAFEFDLEYRRRRLPKLDWCMQRRIGKFRWWDGPGGALFPSTSAVDSSFDEQDELAFGRKLSERMATATGIMLCLDATDPEQAYRLFESLPRRLAATGCSELAVRRVAIVLTKADRKFARPECEAARADSADLADRTPFDRVNEAAELDGLRALLPYHTASTLVGYCPRARFGLAWTSCYGFLPSGEANYDAMHDGLLRRNGSGGEAATQLNSWSPFRVVDPFVWLLGLRATGVHDCDGERLRRALRSA